MGFGESERSSQLWGRELGRERTEGKESEGEGAIELRYREGEGAGCACGRMK
jgi:hypothetical protein